MSTTLHTLENEYWQVGILPETGASVAFGRVRKDGQWHDVLRPTDPADYGNPSKCASFVLIPWSNRIMGGKFRFQGKDYELEINSADGHASHGDTRRRPWQVDSGGRERINLSFNSTAYAKINFPWQFAATADYWLDGRDFIMGLSLKNIDEHAFPAGFGQHPYFVRTPDVKLRLPVESQYELVKSIPNQGAEPLPLELDFRKLRKLSSVGALDHLFRDRQGKKAVRIVYPGLGLKIRMISDPIFEHLIAYAPEGQPFFAVEPVTNANDGFNLYERGVSGTGVFILEPGEEKRGLIRLRVKVA